MCTFVCGVVCDFCYLLVMGLVIPHVGSVAIGSAISDDALETRQLHACQQEGLCYAHTSCIVMQDITMQKWMLLFPGQVTDTAIEQKACSLVTKDPLAKWVLPGLGWKILG